MAILWRISNRCNLAGIGGEKAHGRWHTAAPGKRIVYLAEHAAVALLEVLANLQLNPNLLPDSYQLIKVLANDAVSEEAVRLDELPENWREDAAETRSIGDAWLTRRTSALLLVPSAPSPESFNYLLDPLHADAKRIEVEWCKQIKYDRRLFRTFV
jgi:RES domain-containing protein